MHQKSKMHPVPLLGAPDLQQMEIQIQLEIQKTNLCSEPDVTFLKLKREPNNKLLLVCQKCLLAQQSEFGRLNLKPFVCFCRKGVKLFLNCFAGKVSNCF